MADNRRQRREGEFRPPPNMADIICEQSLSWVNGYLKDSNNDSDLDIHKSFRRILSKSLYLYSKTI